MDTLITTAAGTTAAATLLFCLARIRSRRNRRVPVRVEPTFSLDARMVQVPGMIVGAKPFLVDSYAEWQERVAIGYGQEKGILGEIWDALPEGGAAGETWRKPHQWAADLLGERMEVLAEDRRRRDWESMGTSLRELDNERWRREMESFGNTNQAWLSGTSAGPY